MRAAGITQPGGPVAIFALPALRDLAPDEVRMAVVTAGVGNWDELVRTGSWNVGVQPPMALGVEAAGVITEVGQGHHGFDVGDEILTHAVPLLEHGFWAEQAIVNVAHLARKPADVGWCHAAALPVPGLVAAQALDDSLQLGTGDSLVVNGAGGTTGGLVVQLAVARGIRVIATASSASADRVRRFGAEVVLDYGDSSWPERARQAVGGDGFVAGLNAARGGAAATLRAVACGGQLATITGDPPPIERGIAIEDVYVLPDGQRLQELVELVAAGKLSLSVGARYRLDDAKEALALSVSGRAGGAMALTISELTSRRRRA